MSVLTNGVNQLVNAPLPLMIEKLGLAIASAQSALDRNSIAIAEQMINTKVVIDEKEYSLLSLGFSPTFYAFTEAMVEAKMEFKLAESEDFRIGAAVGANFGMVAVSVTAEYARKHEMSMEGSSSISARLVSLPAPERLKEILQDLSNAQAKKAQEENSQASE
jgi:hypothetical protein